MGCDIHAVVERRTTNGTWITVNTLNWFNAQRRGDGESKFAVPVALSRNYKRFAALGGVRGDGPDPRGVPADLSETARFLIGQQGSDGHSHGWLTMAEAAKVFADTEHWPEADADPQSYPRQFPAHFFFGVEREAVGKHRLVFWFAG